jgi:hypothetical protein
VFARFSRETQNVFKNRDLLATGLQPEFPDNREINREFCEFWRLAATAGRPLNQFRQYVDGTLGKFPACREQGFFVHGTGNSSRRTGN